MKTKICSKCNLEKPISEYNKNKSNKDGLYSYCRSCQHEYMKKYRKDNIEHRKEYDRRRKTSPKEKVTHKICCRCKIDKDISEFSKNIYSKDGYNFKCRECVYKEYRRDKDHIEIKSKICSSCNIEKDRSEFFKHKNGKGGYKTICKKCENEKRRIRNKKKSGKVTVESKKCSKCGIVKPANEFYKNKSAASGLCCECKICQNKKDKIRRNKIKKLEKKIKKEKYCPSCKITKLSNEFSKNSCAIDGLQTYCKKCQSKTNKIWRSKNLDKLRDYDNKRYAIDIQYKLKHNLRKRINEALHGGNKPGSAVKDLGCTVNHLIRHLESLWEPNMSWLNYGEWHIDHIKPLSSFDLTDREQFLEACHYTNLQPLWAADNLAKSNS